MNIKNKADAIARKYRSRNPIEIIGGMNVILIFAPLTGVRGFYQYYKRNNIIYIDENLPYNEKLFVCAHELGHMILHKKVNSIYWDSRTHLNTSKNEIEADEFAINLLITDNVILEHQDYTILQLSRLLGYEEKLIELRLKNADISSAKSAD